jgi:hypothetical protein
LFGIFLRYFWDITWMPSRHRGTRDAKDGILHGRSWWDMSGICVGCEWTENGTSVWCSMGYLWYINGMLMWYGIWMAGWEIPHEKRNFQWEHHRTTWVNFQQDIMVLGSVNYIELWYIHGI